MGTNTMSKWVSEYGLKSPKLGGIHTRMRKIVMKTKKANFLIEAEMDERAASIELKQTETSHQAR